MKKTKEIEDLSKAKHLIWSMETHPTTSESEEKKKEILSETIASWEDASYWLTPLNPNKTHLPVTILVDEGASVRNQNTPICLYFRNSYDETDNTFIPIIINKNPKVIYGNTHLHIYKNDLQKILWFIVRNHKRLIDVAYNRLNINDFVSGLGTMNESKLLLMEMSRLCTDETGLPFDVWIGINKKQHFLGVKFPQQQGVKNTDDFAEIAIVDGKTHSTLDVEPWREKLVKSFVDANITQLIELGKDFSLFDTVRDNLTKVDKKGNPINTEPEYMPCTKKPINGFLRVRNRDGKYNFIKDGDDTCLSEKWFDGANDFQNYDNFTAAFVLLGNTPKWLYPDGRLMDCHR